MQKERKRQFLPFLSYVLFGTMVLSMFLSNAQETEPMVQDSIEINKSILQLEQETGFRFFFMEEWMEEIPGDVDLSGLGLSEALDKLLEGTNLNYYILEEEKRVFLLQNTIIYDELPRNFFGRKDTLVTEEVSAVADNRPPPAFFTENIRRTSRKYPLVRIGKASSNQLRPSYTLRGKALNARTGEPVPDLAIRLQGTNRVTVTDEQGNYDIELPSGYNVLLATAMGIEDMERGVVMYNDGTLNLTMEEGLEQLDEVVVEADAISNVEETSTGTESIDLEESKNIPLVLGERDLLQVAKALPGISSAGEGATGLNVRGGKTDQNLVLLDDAVIYNPTHFFGIFQALNPFTTEGADIYKGSVPVEFGGRLSSVFDIRTKNGDVEKFSGEGSIGPVTGNLALESQLKKIPLR